MGATHLGQMCLKKNRPRDRAGLRKGMHLQNEGQAGSGMWESIWAKCARRSLLRAGLGEESCQEGVGWNEADRERLRGLI